MAKGVHRANGRKGADTLRFVVKNCFTDEALQSIQIEQKHSKTSKMFSLQAMGFLEILREVMEKVDPTFKLFKEKLQDFVYGATSRINKKRKRVSCFFSIRESNQN